jgi:hypothetical protein
LIVAENNLPVELSEGLKVNQFSIKINNKAFKTLYDNIYSDKIGSIVREICSNAVDAHVLGNCKDRQFKVHLPNNFEPWFSVRDYGPGLSHEEVTTLYTTFFESTKTGSNDFIGAWGLGSKIPLSYTDNFTVETVQNERKRIYTIFINSDGIPSITKVYEDRTDEPNGLEVKILVNKGDFENFKEEAFSTLQWFNPRPIITGYPNFEFPNHEWIVKNEIYGIISTPIMQSKILVGNIAYVLKANHIFYPSNIVIFANIGDVDVTTSRESLQFTDKTEKFLSSTKNIIKSRIKDDIINYNNSLKLNEWDKLKYFYNLYRSNNTVYNIINSNINIKVLYKIPDNMLVRRVSMRNNRLHTESIDQIAPIYPILWNDKKFSSYVVRAKLRNFIKSNKSDIYYLIDEMKDEQLNNLLCKDYIKKLSDITHDRVYTYKPRKTIYCYNYYDGHFKPTTYNTNEKYYYCVRDKHGLILNGEVLIQDFVYKFVERLRSLNYLDRNFLVITESSKKNAISSGWLDLTDLINKVIKDYPNYSELSYINKYIGEYEEFFKYIPIENNNSKFWNFIKYLHKGKHDDSLVDLFDKLCIITHKYENIINDMIEDISNNYPILGEISFTFHNNETFMHHIIKYINMVDNEIGVLNK